MQDWITVVLMVTTLLSEALGEITISQMYTPELAVLGGKVTLSCQFNMQDDSLFAMRWFKDNKEFYRYVMAPKEEKFAFDGFDGINVEMEESDSSKVTLKHLTMETAGEYVCEVHGSYGSAKKSAHLKVAGAMSNVKTHSAEVDMDSDGVPDDLDPDRDGDGIPNSKDEDQDGDGIPNSKDNDIDGDGVLNELDMDVDGDGIINELDLDVDGDGIPNVNDQDLDGDGIPNAEDEDQDGDGIPNIQDVDMDGDGVPNAEDEDQDGDGIPNTQDTDVDGDGIPNSEDEDTDNDGIPNAEDTDDDNDGIPDDQENGAPTRHDYTVNCLIANFLVLSGMSLLW